MSRPEPKHPPVAVPGPYAIAGTASTTAVMPP